MNSNDPFGGFETFLRRSKVNLAQKGRARDRFLATVMARARSLMASDPETPPGRDPSRVLAIRAKNLELGPGGSVQMTARDSEQADRDDACGGLR